MSNDSNLELVTEIKQDIRMQIIDIELAVNCISLSTRNERQDALIKALGLAEMLKDNIKELLDYV